MSKLAPIPILFISLILLGCVNHQTKRSPNLARELTFEPDTRTFETSHGRRIKLVLKESDYEREEPANIPDSTFRGHSTSFYQDTATGKVLAESGISDDLSWQLENLTIWEADGTVLIWEDLSDALPGARYILLSSNSVRYLAPEFDSSIDENFTDGSFRKVGFGTLQLLKNGNINQGGQEVSLNSLPSSTIPFSVGG